MTQRKKMPTDSERLAALELKYAQLILKYTELEMQVKETHRRTRVLFAKHFGLVDELNSEEIPRRKQLRQKDLFDKFDDLRYEVLRNGSWRDR